MDPISAHKRSQEVFAGVLALVTADHLDRPTPCTEWDVRGVINHIIGGNHRVTGTPPPDSGSNATVAQMITAYEAAAAAAHEVFRAPDGLTRTFDLPIGSVPGAFFVVLRTTDHVVHAWDIAAATGMSTDLDPELATQMLEGARQRMV